jgi:hypothetical protein
LARFKALTEVSGAILAYRRRRGPIRSKEFARLRIAGASRAPTGSASKRLILLQKIRRFIAETLFRRLGQTDLEG